MLTEVNVTRIGRISTRIDSAPGLLEMVRVSQFARVHELGLQILNDLTTAPQGCRENEVRTWVMAFASALNEIALLEPDVPSLNSWTTNAHRLLLNFQSRFEFVHRPSAEFLARLL
ncbi:hypothetical protein SDC9_159186 [bioreactor metagenome]|uniref:Uncharacterized protein n=1 Tax=bioreactor metagenome TaxID=1076179 RepID=A0A645FBY8_9ZZZZ